ncbi:MAG: hypothetical protein ACLTSV_08435 [Ruminococcus sp.]|uniref:hypothetical protein n=1 Tax=Ruminococcus sp. TaxID=41978 RepID=UPI00266B9F2F|nr:hypothetical protein [uncultured Ruminococcus sp.]
MKTNKNKIWKTGVIAGMLAALVLAFSACGSEPEDSSTAEVKTTTTITVTTEATTTTVETTTTTAKTTTETSEITTTAETTAATAAETKREPEKNTAAAEPMVEKPRATTAKPAQPTPTKKTTAAPKGHYETIHHEAVTQQVWVEDSPAGEKKIFQCRCGLRLNSYNEYVAHSDALLDDYNEHCTYEFWYEDTPAQGHYETQIVKAAYDEQVWVQD